MLRCDPELSTGPDGICDSSANNTDVMSTDCTLSDVEDYLNNTVYNQAAFKWTVTRLPAMTVNFDLNRDGKFDDLTWMSNEMKVVRDACKDDSYDCNIFLIDNPAYVGGFGLMEMSQRYGFVYGDKSPHIPTTISHELGHGGFGLTHASGLGQSINIMTQGQQTKWRLFKGQWDDINQ